ncbi:DUF3068 domain-containing protein [Nocardioides sp. SR21]|uniref:DUF3068 domain-containing protein n=1 Tax=Nocardioides sp. SR21 TaxID=2919501 RepID=UPI001FA94E0D|nr:DUF3068 domain-containing protein [Nocardioides sp. SR21]
MTTTQSRSADGAPSKTEHKKRGGWLGFVLVGLAAFLVVAGLLFQFWAPDQLKRAPIDTDEVTELEGVALLPANFAEPTNLEQADIRVYQGTKSDTDKSDDDVAVYDEYTCLLRDEGELEGCVDAEDPEGRLVTADLDRYATDRRTGEAVNDVEYIGEDAIPHTGLINKWPFDVEKKSYEMWDGVVGDSVEAKFVEETTLKGLDVYVFETDVTAEDVNILSDVPGTYINQATWYVDPVTGSIVGKKEHQERFLNGEDLVLNLDFEFTDAEYTQKVDDAKSNIKLLNLVTSTLPIVFYIAGALCLVAGGLLIRRRRTA